MSLILHPHPMAIAAGQQYRALRWDHFVTLTSKHPETPAGYRREVGRWLRRASNLAQHSLQYVWAVEGDPGAGHRYHLHMVVYGTSDLTVEQLRGCWRRGYRTTPFSLMQRVRADEARAKGRTPTRSRTSIGDSRIRVYDPARDGAAYVVKDLRPDFDDWEMSSKMPPLL